MKKILLIILLLPVIAASQTTGYLLVNVNGTFTLPTGQVVTIVDSNTYNTKYRCDTSRVNVYTGLNTKLATNGNGSALTGLTKTQVGLPNADNTSDAGKPVSTAQQTAINLKANIAAPAFTGSFGYATGSGSSVTQATSKTTGVTLNNICGRITMNGAALAAAAEVSFVVTNSTVAATDVIIVNIQSVGTAGAYFVTVGAVSAGSFAITLGNASAGSLSQAVVLNFAVIKSVIN